jgi:hypothetical protein
MDLEVSFEGLPTEELQRLRISLTIPVDKLDKMVKQT